MRKPIAIAIVMTLCAPLTALADQDPPAGSSTSAAAPSAPQPPASPPPASATAAPPPGAAPPRGYYYYPPPPPGAAPPQGYYYYPPPPPGGYYYPPPPGGYYGPPPSAQEMPPQDDPTPVKRSYPRRSVGAMVAGIVLAGAGGICLFTAAITAFSASVGSAIGGRGDYSVSLGFLIGGLTSALVGAPLIAYGAARDKPSWAGSPGGPGWKWVF